MSAQVSEHFVQQFTDGITHLAQQEMSRLRGAVDVDPSIVGDRKFYNQLGATTMKKRTSRHGDTEYTDTPHHRRMLTLESYDNADLVDTDDKVQMLTDPTNSYSQSFAKAAGRTLDDIVIEAAFATAKTGQTGSGSETWASLTGQIIAHGSTDLTVAKLLTAKEILDGNEVDENDRYVVARAVNMTTLLGSTEVKSYDYNSVKALVNGQVDSFLGFKFIRSERLLNDATPDTRVLCFQKNSIKLGIGINPRGKITEMPNKKYSTQIFYEMRAGAVRMDSTGVIEIKCINT